MLLAEIYESDYNLSKEEKMFLINYIEDDDYDIDLDDDLKNQKIFNKFKKDGLIDKNNYHTSKAEKIYTRIKMYENSFMKNDKKLKDDRLVKPRNPNHDLNFRSGAGSHKDLKKAKKLGDRKEKHKKRFYEKN